METSYLVLESPPSTSLTKTAQNKLLKNLKDEGVWPEITGKKTTIKNWDLPFYEDVSLLELTYADCHPYNARLCFLYTSEKCWQLDGTSPPIHDVNATCGITLSESNVLQYLGFFCFFVRGDEGPFMNVDHLQNTFLPPQSLTKEFEDIYQPPRIYGQDINGDWRVSALTYYSNAVFFADYLIHLEGMVEMLGDNPVLGDLPHKIEAPLEYDGILSS